MIYVRILIFTLFQKIENLSLKKTMKMQLILSFMNIRVKTLGKLPSVEIYSILILKVQNKRSSDIFYNISII